ncbi:MAG: site-specific DNA-methyltransferase, partial [Candidatus Methylumidiphilus sp.]
MNPPNEIKITKAKGRPMLQWVGKKPLTTLPAYPAQHIESFKPQAPTNALADAEWKDWPDKYPQGGLLFHGDNKDVLAHLLANGFRGKVKLIYIDPPFDSGADYVRKVNLRGTASAKLEGEDYSLGEQVQYTDIWANDNYLQFMYERLLLLRELLSTDGSLWLHCDFHRNHQLRCILDEVFGTESFQGEVVWQRTSARSDSHTINTIHDILFFYSKSNEFVWNALFDPHDEEYLKRFSGIDKDGRRYQLVDMTSPHPRINMTYEWKGYKSPENGWRYSKESMTKLDKNGLIWYPEDKNKRPRQKKYLDEINGRPLQSIWTNIYPVNSQAVERQGYPTQKPEMLIERLISISSNPDDLILDCFLGSGTTAAVAQKLGRRWIGCDINKGAIQTTAKRLQTIITEQIATAANDRQTSMIEDDEHTPVKPAQLGFGVWRVNDYDLHIQHNEAVELVAEHLGIQRVKSEGFFDGTRGKYWVKIIPFNHPLTPLDLDSIKSELSNRPSEERDVQIVTLGMELAAKAWLEQHNRNRPINRFHVIELRTDKKYGGIIKHEPASAEVSVSREIRHDEECLIVEIVDVVSPSIVQRLNLDISLFRAQIPEWRAVVDCVLIDTAYDGEV